MLRYARHISGHLTALYDDTFKSGDPRVELWPLMASPMPTIGLCLAYVCLVKWAGPCLMKRRQPFNIRTVMVVYNFAMVLLSLYLFVKLGIYGWFGSYNYRCQPVDYSQESIEMASICWLYFFSKFLEFLDTFFFVARKKFSHVSTLHVIHHSVMPISTWFGVKFTPGGHSTFFAFINSFVHIILYVYYGVSAMGPQMTGYLSPWKRYITVIQMVQFIAIFVHSFQLLFNRECDYPRGFMWWIGFHAVLFWFLFYDFYKNAYSKSKDHLKDHSDNCRPNGHCQEAKNGHSKVT
ncbi:Elongation of very long chain fatty acids protein 7 [Tyrophagus putrescentiae]|nr:Elongation of very long chain fatty acids protein 7 [Tyrophagus putrescentiae]